MLNVKHDKLKEAYENLEEEYALISDTNEKERQNN